MTTSNRLTDIQPEYARIHDTCMLYGLSRTRLYELATNNLVRFVKVGPGTTLVDLNSLRTYLNNLPHEPP